MFAQGFSELLQGEDTQEAEAAAMVIGEALSIYIRSQTER